jgi:hypothetical protein
MKDGRPFTFARLSRKLERFRIWRMAAPLHECTIITGEPNELVALDPSSHVGDFSGKTSHRLAWRNGETDGEI